MKDPQIRQLLKQSELLKYIEDDHSKVVEEMLLPVAKARIDMAVLNGHFHGYEIKGASDTLKRLPNQLEAYSYVFDYLTIVTEKKYCEKILSIIPNWVGVSICVNEDGNSTIEVVKECQLNTEKKGFYIAKLLWRDELIEVLSDTNIPFGKRDRHWILCETISNNMETETLSNVVREKLKARTSWKTKEDYVEA